MVILFIELKKLSPTLLPRAMQQKGMVYRITELLIYMYTIYLRTRHVGFD